MKAIIAKGLLVAAVCLSLVACPKVEAKDKVEVLKGNYMVQCTAPWNDNTSEFHMLNVKRLEFYYTYPAYLRAETDNGVVYHYLAEGESCGFTEQDETATPQSGGNVG